MKVVVLTFLMLLFPVTIGSVGTVAAQDSHPQVSESDLPLAAPTVKPGNPVPESRPVAATADTQMVELVVLSSERALVAGEFLLACGLTEQALAKLAYAVERLSLYPDVFDADPATRARIAIIMMRALPLLGQQIPSALPPAMEAPEADRAGNEEPEGEEFDDFVSPELEKLVTNNIRNGHYDIPITLNRKVNTFVGYFSDPKRKKSVEIGLQRLGVYRETFQRIFKEEGVPQDLIFLGLVESNYHHNALSSAKAKGIWQFIEDTGRNYGLRIDWWVDERCDFEKSTRSACRYLKDLYEMFGDWYLAMAAYNSGENRILRILSSQPGKSYWEMCEDGNLPRETRNYVPAILASVIISKDPDRFGITQRPPMASPFISVEIPSPTDLSVVASVAGVSEDVVRSLNPSLRRFVTPPDVETYAVNVPIGTSVADFARLWDMPDAQRFDARAHTVSEGETVASIAKKYDVSLPTLRLFNKIGDQPALSSGTVLQIPLSQKYRQDPPKFRFNTKAGSRFHRVRKGDTLKSLSRRYGVSAKELSRWNKLRGGKLRVGMTLNVGSAKSEVSGKSDRKASSGKQKGKGKERTLKSKGGRIAAEIGDKRGGSRKPDRADTARKSKKRTHVVGKGDSLSSIAQQHGVTVAALKKANKLKKNAVKPGKKLVIP